MGGGDVMREKKAINIEIGERVKQVREAAGLTQEAFSEMIGLGDKHISAIECGAVGVSLSVLKRICETLSVPADFLLFGVPEEFSKEDRDSEIETISIRLTHLPPHKFKVAKEVLLKVLEAMGY